MTRRRLTLSAFLGVLAIAAAVSFGQPFRGRARTPPGVIPEDRAGVPNWNVDEQFKKDVFTFVRIEYDSFGGGGGRGRRGGFGGYGGRGGWARWATDFPDSDLNFSFRLQQLTSLKVNPDPITMRLTDPRLFDYPFIYIIEPGALSFSEDEAEKLREYLLNGGFLMVDDFWGEYARQHFLAQMKRVFPEPQYEAAELPFEHEIFRCVYRLKEKPQVPSIGTWQWSGLTWEDHGAGSETVHFMGINDDKGRLMAIICHNTDLGDGWEREGESEEYFHLFRKRNLIRWGSTS